MSASRALTVAVVGAALMIARPSRAVAEPSALPASDSAAVDGGAPPDALPAAAPSPSAPAAQPAARAPAAVAAERPSAHAGSPIAAALDQFDFGDYEGVVARLRPLVDNGARELGEKADRLEALRVYGIACTLTDRETAAEGAFLLLLREEPSTRLDPAMVRPEAVSFFDAVRARHRAELLDAYRRGRPRYFWPLDILPLAGQFQNRQWRKGLVIGGVELALLGGTVVTYALLDRWAGADHQFKGHANAFPALQGVNIASFTALLAVTAYGIIDGFVVGHRRQQRERETEARLGY